MKASSFLELSPIGTCCPLCLGNLANHDHISRESREYDCISAKHPDCTFQAVFMSGKMIYASIQEYRGLIDNRYYLSQKINIRPEFNVNLVEIKKPLSSGKSCTWYIDLQIKKENFELRRYSMQELETMKTFL